MWRDERNIEYYHELHIKQKSILTVWYGQFGVIGIGRNMHIEIKISYRQMYCNSKYIRIFDSPWYIEFYHILSSYKFPNVTYPKQRTDYIFLFLLRPILRVLTLRIGIRIKTQTSIRHNFLLLVKVYPKLNKRHSVMCNEGENEVFS